MCKFQYFVMQSEPKSPCNKLLTAAFFQVVEGIMLHNIFNCLARALVHVRFGLDLILSAMLGDKK